MNISVPALKKIVVQKFTTEGVEAETAAQVADVLIYADLRGVSSHGVMRVEHYITRLQAGGITKNPHFSVEKRGTNHLLFKGDNGFGHVICKEAMDETIKVAKEHGSCTTIIQESSHCGALGYFLEQATSENLIAIMCSQTDSAVVPFGGKEPYFGTNPIAYGFPTNDKPIILDMATSNVALGKILYAREKGETIPNTWGVDAQGAPTTDPHQVKSLTPFAGPKGYGMALVVDVLSGILASAAFGPHISKMYGNYEQKRNLGQYLYVLDPNIFGDVDQFKANISQMINELHDAPTAPNFDQVLVPGEIEQIRSVETMDKGIDLPEQVYNYLTS